MKSLLITTAALFAVLVSVHRADAQTTPRQERDEIFRAMADEMRRNMMELQVGDLARAYHMTYTLTIRRRLGVHATMGSILDSDTGTVVTLSVNVRVGTPKFDNTNFFDVSLGFFGSSDDEESFRGRRIPKELSYSSLRREFWLATDASFKQALEVYAKKESALKNRTRIDTTWDFSLSLADELVDTSMAKYRTSLAEMQSLCTDASAIFRGEPTVQNSRVGMEFVPKETFIYTSEGRRGYKVETFAGFEIVAVGQCPDGMVVGGTHASYALHTHDLPSRDSLIRAAKAVAATIRESATAPIIEAYSGPVLFTGQAAGEVFAQVFVPNLVAQRPPLSDAGFSANDRFLAFQNKIGARVLPEWLSVDALPSLKEFEGAPVAGHVVVDDDAFPAKDVKLVEKGYLKTLLASRVPTKRITSTNGHQRGGAAMFDVVKLFTSEKKRQLNDKAIKARLLKLVKDRDLPYGIIVRTALNQNLLMTGVYGLAGSDFPIPQGEGKMGVLDVYRVFPDGREERIRGVEMAALAPVLFKDILAVGTTFHVHNLLAPSVSPSFVTGGSPYLISTMIVPDLLFEDVELRPFDGDMPRTPYLTSPLAE